MRRLRAIFASVRKLPDYGRAAGRWLMKRLPTILGLAAGVLVLWGVVGLLYRFEWSGLGEYINSKGEVVRAKTLWDWLELMGALAIPVGVVLIGYLLQRQERQRIEQQAEIERQRTEQQAEIERQRTKQQAEVERYFADDRIREQALQNYLDRMAELLLENGLGKPEVTEEVRAVAQARTVTVLRRLDRIRQAEALFFLTDANLHRSQTAIFRGATMPRIDLSGAGLSDADMSRANLIESDLSEANLISADLSGANLDGAKLSEAWLISADLTDTDLTNADLSGANLGAARMSGTKLSGANLIGANLRNAKVSEEQLAEAIRDENTIIPDGSKYKPPSPSRQPIAADQAPTTEQADQGTVEDSDEHSESELGNSQT